MQKTFYRELIIEKVLEEMIERDSRLGSWWHHFGFVHELTQNEVGMSRGGCLMRGFVSVVLELRPRRDSVVLRGLDWGFQGSFGYHYSLDMEGIEDLDFLFLWKNQKCGKKKYKKYAVFQSILTYKIRKTVKKCLVFLKNFRISYINNQNFFLDNEPLEFKNKIFFIRILISFRR